MAHINEGQARTIDAICKIVTAIAVVVVGGFTGYSYVTNRTAQTKSAAIEAKKPFLQKQLDFYVDASSTMAVLVTSKDQSELAKAKEHFWTLYWGPLRVVADYEVGQSIDRIATCLDKRPECNTTLENLVTQLNHNCLASLEANWGAAFPQPPTNVRITVP
jgi:hypothetical protein